MRRTMVTQAATVVIAYSFLFIPRANAGLKDLAVHCVNAAKKLVPPPKILKPGLSTEERVRRFNKESASNGRENALMVYYFDAIDASSPEAGLKATETLSAFGKSPDAPEESVAMVVKRLIDIYHFPGSLKMLDGQVQLVFGSMHHTTEIPAVKTKAMRETVNVLLTHKQHPGFESMAALTGAHLIRIIEKESNPITRLVAAEELARLLLAEDANGQAIDVEGQRAHDPADPLIGFRRQAAADLKALRKTIPADIGEPFDEALAKIANGLPEAHALPPAKPIATDLAKIGGTHPSEPSQDREDDPTGPRVQLSDRAMQGILGQALIGNLFSGSARYFFPEGLTNPTLQAAHVRDMAELLENHARHFFPASLARAEQGAERLLAEQSTPAELRVELERLRTQIQKTRQERLHQAEKALSGPDMVARSEAVQYLLEAGNADAASLETAVRLLSKARKWTLASIKNKPLRWVQKKADSALETIMRNLDRLKDEYDQEPQAVETIERVRKMEK